MDITKNEKQIAFILIYVVIFIDAIGLGIIVPVFPQFLMSLTGSTLSDVATYGGGLLFCFAAMQFVFAPILGALSDRYGRRPLLLISLLVLSLDYFVMAFAPTLMWIFVARLVTGIASATATVGSAYILDLSDDSDRTKNLGLIGAFWGIGIIFGPLIGGLLASYGVRVPLLATAALALVNFVLCCFLLPETLAKANRRIFSFKRANPLGTLLHIKQIPFLGALLAVFFLVEFANNVNVSTWSYFVIEQLSWSVAQIGYSMAFIGLVVAIVQGGLIGIVSKRWGDQNTLLVGLGLQILGFIAVALATQSWMIYLALLPICIGSVAAPALRSIIASGVPDNEQGQLQGAISSTTSVSLILSPLVMTQIFRYFTGEQIYFPGAPFIVAAALVMWALVWSLKITNKKLSVSKSVLEV